MSKAGYLARHGTIYQSVQRNPYVTYDRLIELLEKRSGILEDRSHKSRMGHSKRTIQRDLKEMRDLFGIVIEYDRKHKGLVLQEGGNPLLDNFEQLVESSALTNVLVEGSRYAPYLKLASRPYRGLEYMRDYLEAITKHLLLELTYASFDGKNTTRTVAPYQIRQYDGRFYLIAAETPGDMIKCFSLDRIAACQMLEQRFTPPDPEVINKLFAPCLGITKTDGQEQEVLLAYTKEEAPYIRTLPLHPSQQTVEDNGGRLIIKLLVYDTWELRAKIRSYGPTVEVLWPDSLRQALQEDLKKTLKQYAKSKKPLR